MPGRAEGQQRGTGIGRLNALQHRQEAEEAWLSLVIPV
jgi:hypothetical protein